MIFSLFPIIDELKLNLFLLEIRKYMVGFLKCVKCIRILRYVLQFMKFISIFKDKTILQIFFEMLSVKQEKFTIANFSYSLKTFYIYFIAS